MAKKTKDDVPQKKRPKGTRGDAFSIFLEQRRVRNPAGVRRPAKPFESGEHVWLGSAGVRLARKDYSAGKGKLVPEDVFNSIKRLHTDDRLSYGELVALSGDFYGSPEDLYEEKPAMLPWLWEDDDLTDLRRIFESEIGWIEDRQKGKGKAAYPDNNIRMAWNAKSYVELALNNTDHFGWHNMLAYIRHHDRALELARKAAGEEDENWRHALFTNAFADHFLTDAFAAGHIRVPRAEIRAWSKEQGYSEKVAGALSKLLHDQDGHVKTLHGAEDPKRKEDDGLRVLNAIGEIWYTYCDGQLFLPKGSDISLAVRMPVRAVAESVKDLLAAWLTGAMPEGEYAATCFAPVPHPDGPTLAEKFGPNMAKKRFAELIGSVNWYSKIPWIGAGLEDRHIHALLEALPTLMKNLRDNVAMDLERDPNIGRRLAKKYVQGLQRIE